MSHNPAGFKIRVGVVVLDEQNRLLLARQNNRPFWVLPGGTLEPGETIGACAVREIKEEAGLDVTLGPLLFVSDFFPPKGLQVLDVVFLATLEGGQFQMETSENLNEIGFYALDDVQAKSVKPEAVFERLLPMWQSGQWPQSVSYLGGFGA